MELPPDPYAALGVSSTATDQQIKTAYRKLALRCHPDKVPDKGDEFHSISQAYELLADADRRRRYDDEMKFNNLKMSGGSSRRPSTSRYGNVRTRTAERPKQSYDDDVRFREGMFDPDDLNRAASSRKFDDEERPRRTSAPNPSRAKEATKKAERSNTVRDKYRESNERKKQRDRETTRGRSAKYFPSQVESDSGEESFKWVPSRGRSRQDGHRSPAPDKEAVRKLRETLENQRAYVSRSLNNDVPPMDYNSGAAPPPPSSVRPSGSFEDKRRERTSSKVNGFMRRSRRPSVATRDTPSPEPPADGGRRPPGFYSAYSSPSSIKVPSREFPPSSTRRASTFNQESSQYEVPPPPKLERSSTMPTQPGRQTSTRRGSATPAYTTNLRTMETHDSGYSTSNSPSETPSPDQMFSSHTTYTYASAKGAGPDLVNVESYQSGGRSSRRSPDNSERPTLARGSSSAKQKYTPESANPGGAPPPPPAQTTGSRRPSMSRGDSYTTSRRNTSSTQVPPSLSQSRRAASFAGPSSSSPPIPAMKTGRDIGNPPPGASNGNDGYYFGQLRTASPTEYEIPPPPMGSYAPSARRTAEKVNYARNITSDDIRTSPNYPSSAPRRASEQASGAFKDRLYEKQEAARQHMRASEQETSRHPFGDNALKGRGSRREAVV